MYNQWVLQSGKLNLCHFFAIFYEFFYFFYQKCKKLKKNKFLKSLRNVNFFESLGCPLLKKSVSFYCETYFGQVLGKSNNKNPYFLIYLHPYFLDNFKQIFNHKNEKNYPNAECHTSLNS